MTSNVVTDENLRLVYSQQHESWLYDQIAMTKRRLARYAVTLCFGAAWLAILAVFGPQFFSGGTDCVILEGGATLQQVIRDGLVADGTSECAPAIPANVGDAPGSQWSIGQIVVGIASIFVLFFTLLSAAEGVRSFVKLRRYQGDIEDHHALLDKYGRFDAPPAV